MKNPIEIRSIIYIESIARNHMQIDKLQTCKRENLSNKPALLKEGLTMGYAVDYGAGEMAGCSSKITIADRIFYVKLFFTGPSRFFSGDQKGVIQKEISKAEFELWINILADSEADAVEIGKKLSLGKKY